jgi:hypothetical protein
MDAQKLMAEAFQQLLDTEDWSDLVVAEQRIAEAVVQNWQDGMTLEGLVQAARRKLNAPV